VGCGGPGNDQARGVSSRTPSRTQMNGALWRRDRAQGGGGGEAVELSCEGGSWIFISREPAGVQI
jgi:hypothetical protein